MIKDFKELNEIKRTILCSLVNVSNYTANDICVGYFEDKEIDDIKDLLKILKNQGFLNDPYNKETGQIEYCLTEKGQERAEYLSCKERWEKAMEVCSRIHDFSEKTVDRVYDQLLQREVSEQMGSPFSEVINAINNMAGEISSYNMQSMFRRYFVISTYRVPLNLTHPSYKKSEDYHNEQKQQEELPI